ncbi:MULTISPECIES: phage tail tube protein [unclassified Streptomyces]|uniref:phage tail tube protein n=1 Tax=unclassified Streptomyces TaxID=2593676 RepID=UPI00036D44F4|nr:MULTISPECIES: phage tail tube protein [unclassified Streptomyces]MYS34933.1 outer capsid protein Hoc [Streptomyces sp. SID4920]MYX65290.1 outer capsid protein Hoc [Streptomyces sp. SID8373]
MAGIDGFGTILKRGDGETPEVFTAIANITGIEDGGRSRNTIDVTAHDSPDQYMEFVGGLIDPGEVTADVNYDPAVHDVLEADLEDKDPRNYQIVFPDTDATTFSFAAVMTGLSKSAPYDNKLSASLTFKVSGKPTIA